MSDRVLENPRLAVITTRGILRSSDWVARVSHDEDDEGWQFLGANQPTVEEAAIVSLQQMVDIDPTLWDVMDLPVGWMAWRSSMSAPWQRGVKQ